MEIQSPCLEASRFQIGVVSDREGKASAPDYLSWDVLIDGQSLRAGTVDPGALIDSWTWSGWAAFLVAIEAAPSPEWDESPRRIWPFGCDWYGYVRRSFNAAVGRLATLAEDYPWLPARIDVARWLADRGSTLTRDLSSSDRHLDVVEWLQRDEELLARWQQWQGCFDERGHAVAGRVEEHLDEVGLGFASAIKRILAPDSDVRYFSVRELRPFGRPALSCLEHIEVAATAAPHRIQKET